jgi:hypothetical protein
MTATNKVGSGASNVSTSGQKRLVIVGASGMVGGYALRYALDNPAVRTVTSIGRKKLGISHPKLKEVLHQDFADCSALANELSGQDAAVYCLGTYTGSVSDAELRVITADYTIEFARVLRKGSPDAAFSFLSGNGADQTGREGSTCGRFPARLSIPARVHLPCATPKGTNFQLPAITRGLSRVSIVVSQPGRPR